MFVSEYVTEKRPGCQEKDVVQAINCKCVEARLTKKPLCLRKNNDQCRYKINFYYYHHSETLLYWYNWLLSLSFFLYLSFRITNPFVIITILSMILSAITLSLFISCIFDCMNICTVKLHLSATSKLRPPGY